MQIKSLCYGTSFGKKMVLYTRGALGENFKEDILSIPDEVSLKIKNLVNSKIVLGKSIELKDNDLANEIVNSINDVSIIKIVLDTKKDKSILATSDRISLINGFINEDRGLFLNLYV